MATPTRYFAAAAFSMLAFEALLAAILVSDVPGITESRGTIVLTALGALSLSSFAAGMKQNQRAPATSTVGYEETELPLVAGARDRAAAANPVLQPSCLPPSVGLDAAAMMFASAGLAFAYDALKSDTLSGFVTHVALGFVSFITAFAIEVALVRRPPVPGSEDSGAASSAPGAPGQRM